MTVRKNKKNFKFRGRRTRGYGRISGGHRKGGQRGGKGRAGSTGHHKILYQKEMLAEGRGFVRPNPTLINPINIGELDSLVNKLVTKEKIKAVKGKYELNLKELGYTKLLGKGTVTSKIDIQGTYATEKAIDKIQSAGGSFTKIEEPKQ